MFHVCKICGKKFATLNGVYGHMRVHSVKRKQSSSTSMSEIEQAAMNFVMFSKRAYDHPFPLRIRESSSMTETEQHELIQAAMTLEMLSASPGVVLQLECMKENIIHCAELKQDLSHGASTTTCGGDAVAQPVPSPLTSECKFFGGFQALGGLERGELERIKKDFEDGNSLFRSIDSGANKVVPQPSCFQLKYTDVKEHCVESEHDLSDVVAAQPLPSPLTSRLLKKRQGNSSHECNICGKSTRLGCGGGHKSSTRGELALRRTSEANKFVSHNHQV